MWYHLLHGCSELLLLLAHYLNLFQCTAFKLWRASWPALPEHAAKQLHEGSHSLLPGQMLSEHICRVDLPLYLPELHMPFGHFLLHPQSVRGDVAQFSEPLATTNANGCGTVRPHSYREFLAEVT